jgi:hypothetical protein
MTTGRTGQYTPDSRTEVRLIHVKAESSDFSGIQMPRQQIFQFWSEDFVANDLQILGLGKYEDPFQIH